MNQSDSIEVRQVDSTLRQQSDTAQRHDTLSVRRTDDSNGAALRTVTVPHASAPLTATAPAPRQQEALQMLLRPADSLMQAEAPDTTLHLAIDLEGQLAPYKDMPVVQRQSLFTRHEQTNETSTVHLRASQEGYFWSFGIVILLLGLMSLYLHSRKFKFKDLVQSMFDSRALDRMFRENNLKPRSFLPMVLLYIASATLTAVMIGARGTQLDTPFPMLVNYLLLFAGVALFVLVRTGVIRLFGNVFEESDSVDLYITNCYLFYFWGALVSVPLSLLLLYGPQSEKTSLYILTTFIAIIFILRLFRGLQLFLTNSKSGKLYLFYYLCIFEIVPILVLLKMLIW